jgi:hypothetical protein
MDEIQTKGWLPIDIDFDVEPAVVNDAQVRWMEIGATPLGEPFFGQTVDKLRAAIPPPMEIDTRLDAMIRISSRLTAVRPHGFIFHVSHCGSTLVANVLKSARDTVVAAEAPAFGRLARLYPEPPSRYLKDRWECSRRMLFESLFALFAHYRTGAAERLVIKFQSLNLLCMKWVRTLWPLVPCVVLVRDPVEVLASSLSEQGWLAWKSDPAAARVSFGIPDLPDSPQKISDAEFCARVLGQHLEAALDAVDARCKVIDYEDLNPKRVRDIAAFFGLELPEDNKQDNKGQSPFLVYSKDPAKVAPFQDDRLRKQRLVSSEARAAAYRWAMPAYSELRGKGFW